jgi:hypothetical protein
MEADQYRVARSYWLALINAPLLDRQGLDTTATALVRHYVAAANAVARILLADQHDALKRKDALVDHQKAEIERLKADLDVVAHERDILYLARSASTAPFQNRNPDGTFAGDGGGGGQEGAQPQTPSGGKGSPASSPGARVPVDAGSVLTQWATSAAFGRAVRASVAKGQPSADAVALLQVIAESPRATYPLYRAVDPALASVFTERENCDLNVCSFSRNVPASAALTLRILPGAHVADASPFSPRDEGEHAVAGRFQVVDITATEVVLGRLPGSHLAHRGRNGAPRSRNSMSGMHYFGRNSMR